MHEDTLRSLSFVQGKILIATEEVSKIEQWIQLVVQGVQYDILVMEISSFVNPDDVELPSQVIHLAQKSSFKTQEKVGNGSVAKGVVEEDDDMTVLPKGRTNDMEGVDEGAGDSDYATVQGKEKGDRVGGPKHVAAGGHLMVDKGDVQVNSEDFESLVEESVVQDTNLGLLAHLELLPPFKAQ